eukprot:g14778.t1
MSDTEEAKVVAGAGTAGGDSPEGRKRLEKPEGEAACSSAAAKAEGEATPGGATTRTETAAPGEGDSTPAGEKSPFSPPKRIQPRVVPFVPHTDMPAMTEPVEVVYCPVDGFPPEYCQWGGKFEQCKPWLMQNCPELYPELAGVSLADAKETASKAKSAADEKAKQKELPGGKKQRSASPKVWKSRCISIKVAARQGRKKTTTIVGLDGFDVKLDAAAKLFKKKFACGSAAVTGNPGQPDSVEIQGEPGREELFALIKKEFPQINVKKIDYAA